MKINEARAFIETSVLEPALRSPAVADIVKSTIRNSLRWLREFQRVGDLILYMDRFRGGADTEVYKWLKAAGLLTAHVVREATNLDVSESG
jgi:5-methylcytosine-specific restriction protein A